IGEEKLKGLTHTSCDLLLRRDGSATLLAGNIGNLHILAPSMPYTWIEESIDELGEKVRQQDGERDDQETALHQGIIILRHRIEKRETDARIVEHDLGQQRAADDQAQGDREAGDAGQ